MWLYTSNTVFWMKHVNHVLYWNIKFTFQYMYQLVTLRQTLKIKVRVFSFQEIIFNSHLSFQVYINATGTSVSAWEGSLHSTCLTCDGIIFWLLCYHFLVLKFSYKSLDYQSQGIIPSLKDENYDEKKKRPLKKVFKM